jgi:hypothetical protein
MIADAAERETDRWPLGRHFALLPQMQAITLDAIMIGIFGIEEQTAPTSPEGRLRRRAAVTARGGPYVASRHRDWHQHRAAPRLDLQAPDPAPEHAVHRVTTIPSAGARVVVRARGRWGARGNNPTGELFAWQARPRTPKRRAPG